MELTRRCSLRMAVGVEAGSGNMHILYNFSVLPLSSHPHVGTNEIRFSVFRISGLLAAIKYVAADSKVHKFTYYTSTHRITQSQTDKFAKVADAVS